MNINKAIEKAYRSFYPETLENPRYMPTEQLAVLWYIAKLKEVLQREMEADQPTMWVTGGKDDNTL